MKAYHLKWSSHIPNMESVFTTLFESESMTDVTICCSGENGEAEYLKSHKILLSTCSNYFLRIFLEVASSKPVIIIPDIDSETMKLLLNFIYTGQVWVNESKLKSILTAAEALEIGGLRSAYEDDCPVIRAESNGNKRKAKSPRQRKNLPQEYEEPKDLSNKSANDYYEHGSYSTKEETPPEKRMTPLLAQTQNAWEENRQENGVFANYETVSNNSPSEEKAMDPSSGITNLIQQYTESVTPGINGIPSIHPFNLSPDDVVAIINSSTYPICPLCGKDCANFPNLRSHLNAHNNVKPYACDFCDYKFSRASHLNRHRRTHTGEKPFACTTCGKLFSRQDKLKTHVDRHNKDQKDALERDASWQSPAAFPVHQLPSYYSQKVQNDPVTSYLKK